jgi:hypothetical protein
LGTAARAAALFEGVGTGTAAEQAPRTVPAPGGTTPFNPPPRSKLRANIKGALRPAPCRPRATP